MGGRKSLKLLDREMSDFAVSCDFKGLRPVLFRTFFSLRFSIRASGLEADFLFSELLDSTNAVFRKAKGESSRSHMCGFTESVV